MSQTVMVRALWTRIPKLSAPNTQGKTIKVSACTAKSVLVAIADNADDYGEHSYSSYETLSIKASLERRSVIRVCKILEYHGYIIFQGYSEYGTPDFSVNLDKLGNVPKKRNRRGRPRKNGDSESPLFAKNGDSESPPSDSESPDPLNNNNNSAAFKDAITFYESNIAPITPYDSQLLGEMCDEHTAHWVIAALKICVENNKRNLKYCNGILKRWKTAGNYGNDTKTEGKVEGNQPPQIPLFTEPPIEVPLVDVEKLRALRAQMGR